jgi:hypothetical protein
VWNWEVGLQVALVEFSRVGSSPSPSHLPWQDAKGSMLGEGLDLRKVGWIRSI